MDAIEDLIIPLSKLTLENISWFRKYFWFSHRSGAASRDSGTEHKILKTMHEARAEVSEYWSYGPKFRGWRIQSFNWRT